MSQDVRIMDQDTDTVIHPETRSEIVTHNGAPLSTVVSIIQGSVKALSEDLSSLPDDVAGKSDLSKLKSDIMDIIEEGNVGASLFIDDSKTESSSAGSYSRGITVSSVGKRAMPTFDTEGILITFKTGLSSNSGQLFIDYHGTLYGRKANFIASWGDWGGGSSGGGVDLSNYVTKDDIRDVVRQSDVSNMASKDDIPSHGNELMVSESVTFLLGDFVTALRDQKVDTDTFNKSVKRLESAIDKVNTSGGDLSDVEVVENGMTEDLRDTGIYFLTDMWSDQDMPQDVYYAYLLVIEGVPEPYQEVIQILFDATNDHRIFVRYLIERSWTEWVALATMDDIEGTAKRNHSHISTDIVEYGNKRFVTTQEKNQIRSIGLIDNMNVDSDTIVGAINTLASRPSGGGSSAVTSVNGKVGEVTLDADDIMVSPGWSVYNELSRKASSYLLNTEIEKLRESTVSTDDIDNITNAAVDAALKSSTKFKVISPWDNEDRDEGSLYFVTR